jgi:hypothetical protein
MIKYVWNFYLVQEKKVFTCCLIIICKKIFILLKPARNFFVKPNVLIISICFYPIACFCIIYGNYAQQNHMILGKPQVGLEPQVSGLPVQYANHFTTATVCFLMLIVVIDLYSLANY